MGSGSYHLNCVLHFRVEPGLGERAFIDHLRNPINHEHALHGHRSEEAEVDHVDDIPAVEVAVRVLTFQVQLASRIPLGAE